MVEDSGADPALAKAEPASRLGPSGFDPGESDLLAKELRGLAIELHRRHYSHVPQWRVSSSPRGALSQIDNMAAGMADRIDALKAAISWFEPPFVDENTSHEELKRRVQFALKDAQRASPDGSA